MNLMIQWRVSRSSSCIQMVGWWWWSALGWRWGWGSAASVLARVTTDLLAQLLQAIACQACMSSQIG